MNRKEPICNSCFNKFIQGKLRKSLMSDIYKVNSKYGVHKVMIAYSGSESSLATLNMLYELLSEQKRSRGTPGFELFVVNIDEGDIQLLDQKLINIFEDLKAKYPAVEFKLLDAKHYMKLIQKDITQLDILNLDISTREDFLQVWYDRILLAIAKEKQYGTIMYCDTMNQVAVESLSLIIKGRGTKVPQKVNDTQHDGIWIKHPIKELFATEIEYYLEINNLTNIVRSTKPISNINKNMTIKQIVRRYLNNVEQDGYASTVPTVVKISEKLIAPSNYEHHEICSVCGDDIYEAPRQWLDRITVNEPAELTTPEELENYEMFKRSKLPQESDKEQQSQKLQQSVQESICYGCMVNMPF